MKRWIRIVLTVLSAAIGLTAVAGGLALIIGGLAASGSGIVPSRSYLGGSPFTSYAAPGVSSSAFPRRETAICRKRSSGAPSTRASRRGGAISCFGKDMSA